MKRGWSGLTCWDKTMWLRSPLSMRKVAFIAQLASFPFLITSLIIYVCRWFIFLSTYNSARAGATLYVSARRSQMKTFLLFFFFLVHLFVWSKLEIIGYLVRAIFSGSQSHVGMVRGAQIHGSLFRQNDFPPSSSRKEWWFNEPSQSIHPSIDFARMHFRFHTQWLCATVVRIDHTDWLSHALLSICPSA